MQEGRFWLSSFAIILRKSAYVMSLELPVFDLLRPKLVDICRNIINVVWQDIAIK